MLPQTAFSFLMGEEYFIVCVCCVYICVCVCIYTHCIFIHSSGHQTVSSVVNSVAVNTGVHVSFQSIVFPRYVPKSGIARSYDSFFLVC